MTAAEIADLLHARVSGRGKWQGHCPAHDDRTASLSIAAGRDGRVLIRCWAGCETEAVLKAAGLRMTDLFAGPPPTPEQIRQAAQQREREEQQARERRRLHSQACNRLHKLGRIIDALGEKLVRQPEGKEGDAVAELFSAALKKMRAAEARETELRP